MIKSLSVRNVVLIEKLDIEFSPHLCILTGETGSGKSILLDALCLAIGFRSNARLIGSNDDKASVSAVFDISNNENCQKFLAENELLDKENKNLVRIRRVLQEGSTNKVFVNDIQIGVNLLAKIGEFLIEIHGQHDQRGLLNQSHHIEILDQFSCNQNLLKDLRNIYNQIKNIQLEIEKIKLEKDEIIKEKEYLTHIIKEISDANISQGEEDELLAKKNKIISLEKITKVIGDLNSHVNESSLQLTLAQKVLMRNSSLIDNFFGEKNQIINNFSDNLDKEISNIDSYISALEDEMKEIKNFDYDLEKIEERIFLIRNLSRKYNIKSNDFDNKIKEAKASLDSIFISEKLEIDLEKKLDNLQKEYHKIAKEISDKRKSSAKILATKVEDELKFLKMENSKFLVEITNDDNCSFSYNGYDKVSFRASINKNSFDDISKIASGGELSRFMLALKVALINVKSVPTIIFDEIDSGIGGVTADAVGNRLKSLANNFQILTVTHSPQIAARAHSHFKISKFEEDNKIKTCVEKLTKDQRELEVARMISGEKISKEAIMTARILIE